MNDIYWQEKRAMSAKQISSSSSAAPPTQPRRIYDDNYPRHLSPLEMRLGGQSNSARIANPVFDRYARSDHQPTMTSQNFSYQSSLHGVYPRSPPAFIASSSRMHMHDRRPVDPRQDTQRVHHRPLSRSASEDYYSNRFQETNGYNHDIYSDENETDDPEDSSDTFGYQHNDRVVS